MKQSLIFEMLSQAKIKRQVRYDCERSEDYPEAATWYFEIIEDSKTIGEVERKIYKQLFPTFNDREKVEFVIKKTPLRYRLVVFDSGRNLRGKVHPIMRRDENLHVVAKSGNLEVFLARRFS